LEYTVNLIGSEPGAKSNTLKSLTFFTSTPGSAPIAFLKFEESIVTNKTLFPTFLVLPLSLDCPERIFLDSNLFTSCDNFSESNTLVSLLRPQRRPAGATAAPHASQGGGRRPVLRDPERLRREDTGELRGEGQTLRPPHHRRRAAPAQLAPRGVPSQGGPGYADTGLSSRADAPRRRRRRPQGGPGHGPRLPRLLPREVRRRLPRTLLRPLRPRRRAHRGSEVLAAVALYWGCAR